MNLPDDSSLSYRNDRLYIEDVSLESIAAKVGTPVYCYSSAVIERNFRQLQHAVRKSSPRICFAVKANSNLAVLSLLAELGAGADVVSEGELRRALAAGIAADQIIFAGVGKTRREIQFALGSGISQLNVESDAELEMIAEIASETGVKVPVAVRVNPNIDAQTNTKITTGTEADKFGIPASQVQRVYRELCANPSFIPRGLAVHIGSQLTDLGPFRRAYTSLTDIVHELQREGLPVPGLDLGGGLGIVYQEETPPSFVEYADVVAEVADRVDCQLTLEPGRSLVGNAGILLSQVIRRKSYDSRTFIVLDAAMNDLLRPGLYEAEHKIVAVTQRGDDSPVSTVDFVGPICETSDTFCRNQRAQEMEADDLIAILGVGAYGAVMASTYNTRPLIPEVMVKAGKFDIIRQRGTYEAMLEQDSVPSWLKGGLRTA